MPRPWLLAEAARHDAHFSAPLLIDAASELHLFSRSAGRREPSLPITRVYFVALFTAGGSRQAAMMDSCDAGLRPNAVAYYALCVAWAPP